MSFKDNLEFKKWWLQLSTDCMKQKKAPVIAIFGPTASGKSSLCAKINRRLLQQAEILSFDSRQLYQNFDLTVGLDLDLFSYRQNLGFANHDINGIQIFDPLQKVSVTDYIRYAQPILKQNQENNQGLLLVGGSGFYLKQLIWQQPDYSFKSDHQFCQTLERKLSNSQATQLLKLLNFENSQLTDNSSKRRVVRSIEKTLAGVKIKKPSEQFSDWLSGRPFALIFIEPELAAIKQRISDRLIQRMGLSQLPNSGLYFDWQKFDWQNYPMLHEVCLLLNDKKVNLARMNELGLEFRHLATFIQGSCDLKQMLQALQHDIYQFARSQMTFSRHLAKNPLLDPKNPKNHSLVLTCSDIDLDLLPSLAVNGI